MSKTIGILTGGGDVPGLNPCIKAVVFSALDNGYRVLGIRRGWSGLLHYDLNEPSTYGYYVQELTRNIVRTVDRSGGTFLHTSRTNPQNVNEDKIPDFLKTSKYGKKNEKTGTMDYTDYVLKVLEHLGVDIVIPIGGDDTLSFGVRLHQEGMPVVSIPKTMDNDVYGTDFCIGFSTAVTRSVEFITNMRTSAGSHERIAVVELFGRYSGETSLISAYLAYVDRAIISEVPFDIEKISALLLEDKRSNPSNYAIMTISEGATFEGGDIVVRGEADMFGHRKLGGIGQIVADEIKRITKQDILHQQVGYLMRSGAPDSLDRMVAMSYGNLAIQLIRKNETGRMVALRGGRYTTVPVDTMLQAKKRVDVEKFYDKDIYRPCIKEFIDVPMFLS